MKTNVIMKSQDRELFGIIIRHETKTGFLNLSDLSTAYNKRALEKGWSEKRVTEVLNQKENSERVYYVLKEQGLINTSFNVFMEQLDNHGGFFGFLKKLKVYKTTGARHTKTTWCNPYIWMLAALEMNPELYGKTVVWLTDKLIINRIEAGNMYRGLTSAVAKWDNVDWGKLAKALNFIVFDRHETGIRNFANQRELKEMELLEAKMAFAVEMDYIKSFDSLITELRKIYNQKNQRRIQNS